MRIILIISGFGVIAALAMFWTVTQPALVLDSELPKYSASTILGEEVFNAGGCASCHASPGQARTVLGGGGAIPSPFGTFYAPNISTSTTDGIGGWTEANFITALTKGTSPAGTHYFPSFPYGSYQRANVQDLRDLYAYLKTLPPAAGRARDHDIGFPFNIRRLVGVWKFFFLDQKTNVSDLTESQQWNRGAYLVNGLGHCAECHSPRNVLGGIISDQRFAGGPDPEGMGWVPNITQKRLQNWSIADISNLLKTGELPEGDSVGGSMVRVIKNVSLLKDSDRVAMAEYIKSLPAIDGPSPAAKVK